MRLVSVVASVALCASLASAHGRARQKPAAGITDWPQWRGSARDGSVTVALPAEWPDALTKRWEVPVGIGHASPVVSGNRVVVMAREGDQEIVRALDATSGKEIWRASYPAPYTVNPSARSHGAGPKSTPAIAGGRVFTLGIGGVLSAFDLATGKLLWRTPAPAVLPEYGAATSPLIDPSDVNSVIAHLGGNDKGALTAFDAATGKPRWQWTGDGPGSGSPIIATIGGVRQVIAQTQKLLVGLNASTGSLLWQLPFRTDFDQNAFTPVVFQDLVIVGGTDQPLTAIRLKLVDGKWVGETAWTNPQTPMFMSTPVIIGGTLYGLTERSRGQFVAIDAASGRTLWNTEGREGENASMMGSRSWLLASTTDGKLVVARTNAQKYAEVRRYQIAQSAVWAHPAITSHSIIVKDVDKVICWSLPAPAPVAQSSPKDAIASRIDSLARAQLAGGIVSLSIAVSRKKDVLFERAYGLADIATQRRADAATVYRITGASMQFTAALMLKQIERGKLAIDDPIGRHLTTGLPPEWRPITIEQLLSHTSGLAGSITRDTPPEQPASSATLIAWAARDPLKFTPGISFSYSRVGYLLLGALVEKLYGKPYDAVLRDEIARPLGLASLGWCAEAGKGTMEATGYEDVSPTERKVVSNLHPSKELGAGGICATAGDLNAWTRALHSGRVLSSTSYTTFTTSIKSLERPAIAECCFMMVPRARGAARSTLQREDGFSTEIAWFARDSLSVTVLYNTSSMGIIGLLPLEIADAVGK